MSTGARGGHTTGNTSVSCAFVHNLLPPAEQGPPDSDRNVTGFTDSCPFVSQLTHLGADMSAK